MFGFIKSIFFTVMTFFSCNALKCISMNNQKCKIRPQIINVNSNETSFYPYSIEINECSGSCNNINDLYAKLRAPDVVKNINIKVFNIMSLRHTEWDETCKCKCRLDASVWYNEKCRCECKELIDKEMCDTGFT